MNDEAPENSSKTSKETRKRKNREIAPKDAEADDRARAIAQTLQKVFPEHTPPEVIRQTITRSFSGPLPHPEDFERYEQTLPGMADRIMKTMENEQDMRDRHTGSALGNDRLKIWGSIFCTALLIVSATVASYFGQAELAMGFCGNRRNWHNCRGDR